MECKHCNNIMIAHVRKCDTFHECVDCASGAIDYLKTCCISPQLVNVNLPRSDGKPTKRQFCLNCGHRSAVIKMSQPNECSSYPILTQDKIDNLSNARYAVSRNFWRYIEKKRIEKRDADKDKWFRDVHNPYLKSKEWKYLRSKVLKRDSHTCQSCLINTATQVHHKSYDYHTNEPAFNLVSVCDFCHDQITAMDRGEGCEHIHNITLVTT